MSHENSLQIDQSELSSEYGRYVESKSKKGPFRFLVKALVIPVVTLLIILAGAVFAVANFSPATYALAKNIIFAEVDVEKLTGLSDSAAREYLDNLLIINTEQQQMGTIVREDVTQKETAQSNQVESPLK